MLLARDGPEAIECLLLLPAYIHSHQGAVKATGQDYEVITGNVAKGMVYQKLGSFPFRTLGATQGHPYSVQGNACTTPVTHPDATAGFPF